MIFNFYLHGLIFCLISMHVNICLEVWVLFLCKQSTTTSFSSFCGVDVTVSFAIVTTISTAQLALLNRPNNAQWSHIFLPFFQYNNFNPYFLNNCLWPLKEENWFRSQARKYWVFGKPVRILTGFPARRLVFPLSVFYHSTFVPYSFWYKHHRQCILPKLKK